jgi:gliding motility-associated-like protein
MYSKIKYRSSIAALLVFTCSILRTSAQKEGFVWHFGVDVGIEFSSGSPKLVQKSVMKTFEGCASYSDANGNLLFYTNGGGRDPVLSGQSSGKIWNRNHEVMYDMGNTEGGGFSSEQSAVIIPKPGAAGRYLLFTMDEVEFDVGGAVPGQPNGRGLSYFEVDMGLNGGLGGVAKYTPSIYVPTFEGLCAVRHTNGTDYWILVHKSGSSDGFAVFAVTGAGISAPKIYDLAQELNGSIKASPDGQWLAARGNDASVMARFDPTTGIVGAPILYPHHAFEGYDFAPNSKRLYFNNQNTIYSLLLEPGAGGALPKAVPIHTMQGQDPFVGLFQVAPDNKIYFITQGASMTLSAIVCPNSADAFVQEDAVFLSDFKDNVVYFALPNFSNHLFRNDNVPSVAVDLGTDRTLCTGTPLTLSPGNIPGAQYKWSDGSTTASIPVVQSGKYSVTVSGGCAAGSDSVNVKFEDLKISLGPDLVVCDRDSIRLKPEGNAKLFRWPTGQPAGVANPLVALKPGVNIFIVRGIYDACTALDTLVVTRGNAPTLQVKPESDTIKKGASVQLVVSGGAADVKYNWTPKEGLSCTNCPDPTAKPTQSTVYTVTAQNANGCSQTLKVDIRVKEPDCTVEYPNAFTPNNDRINDAFFPANKDGKDADFTEVNLQIFNRWGELVYAGSERWDGKVRGEEAPADVYAYRISLMVCGEPKSHVGDVTLLR